MIIIKQLHQNAGPYFQQNIMTNSQCWPVFDPQMIGEPRLPGVVNENVSVTQSPTEPPIEIKSWIKYTFFLFNILITRVILSIY